MKLDVYEKIQIFLLFMKTFIQWIKIRDKYGINWYFACQLLFFNGIILFNERKNWIFTLNKIKNGKNKIK